MQIFPTATCARCILTCCTCNHEHRTSATVGLVTLREHARTHAHTHKAASWDATDMKYDIRAEWGFTLRCPAVAAAAADARWLLLLPLPWLCPYG